MRQRHTFDRGKSLEYQLWLVFNIDGSVRAVRSEPDLSRTERAMFLKATLPKSLWSTPTLRGSITVPDNGPVAFEVDVPALADQIKAAVGVDLDLRVEHPREA